MFYQTTVVFLIYGLKMMQILMTFMQPFIHESAPDGDCQFGLNQGATISEMSLSYESASNWFIFQVEESLSSRMLLLLLFPVSFYGIKKPHSHSTTLIFAWTLLFLHTAHKQQAEYVAKLHFTCICFPAYCSYTALDVDLFEHP